MSVRPLGRVSKDGLLLVLAGLFMTAFQLRFAFDRDAYKLISIFFVVAILILVALVVNGMSGAKRWPVGFLMFGFLFLFSCVVEFVVAGKSFFYMAVLASNIFFVGVLAYLVFQRARYNDPVFLVKVVYVNIFIYVAVNLALYFVGIRKSWADQFIVDYDSGRAVMLGAIGYSVERAYFMLSNGINSYGGVSGVLLGLSIILFRRTKWAFFSFVAAAITCLLIDSRSAILFCILAVLISWFVAGRGYWRLGLFIAILLPLFPLISGVVYYLVGLVFGGTDALVRSDSDGGSLGGRSLIWMSAIKVFQEFSLYQVLGYGNAGQVTSGVSSAIGATQEFSNYVNVESHSVHNFYLQALLNYGYLGFLLVVFLLFSVFSGIRRYAGSGECDRTFLWALLFVFYFIMFINNTEVSIIYPGQLFFPFLLFVFVMSGYRYRRSIGR